ncbi:MAG: hypothetical protein WBF33_16040 [Candidatus Nitrosopolaris sp.]
MSPQSVTEVNPRRLCTIALDPELKKNLRRIAVIRNSSLHAELNKACRQYVMEYIRTEGGK